MGIFDLFKKNKKGVNNNTDEIRGLTAKLIHNLQSTGPAPSYYTKDKGSKTGDKSGRHPQQHSDENGSMKASMDIEDTQLKRTMIPRTMIHSKEFLFTYHGPITVLT